MITSSMYQILNKFKERSELKNTRVAPIQEEVSISFYQGHFTLFIFHFLTFQICVMCRENMMIKLLIGKERKKYTLMCKFLTQWNWNRYHLMWGLVIPNVRNTSNVLQSKQVEAQLDTVISRVVMDTKVANQRWLVPKNPISYKVYITYCRS